MTRRLAPLLSLALLACGQGGAAATFPTGSTTLSIAPSGDRLVVLDPDAGQVLLVDQAAGITVDRLVIGDDPVRVARAGDTVLVTLRAAGQVVALAQSGDGLTEVGRIDVGAEPYGVVASHDGARAFVAISQENRVVEIDVASLSIVRSVPVGAQPRWLALHPSGRALFVGSAMGGTWAHVDLERGVVATYHPPERFRIDPAAAQRFPLAPRITGDIAVSPDGRRLALPVLYVDPSSPVTIALPDPTFGYYANDPSQVIGRTTPSVVYYTLDGDGAPDLALAVDTVPVVAADPARTVGGRQDARRSALSSVTWLPTNLGVLATMEAGGAVAVVPAVIDGLESDPAAQDWSFWPLRLILTSGGPRGVVFDRTDGRPWVDSWLAHEVSPFRLDAVLESLRESVLLSGSRPGAGLAFVAFSDDRDLAFSVAPPTLDPDLEEGRRLFLTATDGRISAHGSGMACATCHFDGRTDGLTWGLPEGELQTPSLAGPVTLTEPVTWLNGVATVADEVLITSRERMGGSGLTEREAGFVSDFLDSTPYPSVAPQDPAAVERGRAVFNGPAGCATCHVGELYTDTLAHDMFDLVGVRTPTLRGIAATPPYLHDGRATTLDELVEISEAGGMGTTSHLSVQDKRDLVAFLASL